VAAPKAPLLDGTGKKSKDVTLTAEVFGVDVKPHLIHEVVRAEGAAARAGTRLRRAAGSSLADARSHGARRAPGGHAPGRPVRRSGRAAASPSRLSREATR
jgi:ribosomal protein L4